MMRLKVIFASLACFCAGLVSAQTLSGPLTLDPEVRFGKLENGLTYYIRRNVHPENQVEFYIAQKVGSMQEEEEQRGLAHFLEHMCFNGTKNFPGNRLVKYLESIGVKFGENLNAYTAFDETVYNISGVPTGNPAALDSCLLILHDWSNALLLEEEEIDKERSVIHQEWRQGNKANKRMYERALPKMFPDNRYGERLPIGLMSVVDNFEPKVLRDYYHRWYRPDLQGIIVVGDIQVDEMEEKIKNLFGPIKMPQNAQPRVYTPVADNTTPIVICEEDPEMTITAIQIFYKHDLCPDSLKDQLSYIEEKIKGSMAVSMINERLSDLSTNPDVPFAAAYCGDENFMVAKTKGAFTVTIIPKEGQENEAIKTVMAEVYRADRYGFTATELQRVSAKAQSSLESIYQNKDKRKNGEFVQEYVNHFLSNEPAPGIEVEYPLFTQYYSSIPVERVNELYNGWVADTDTNLVVYMMSPQKEGLKKPTEEQLLAVIKEAYQTDLGPYQDKFSSKPLIENLPAAGKIVKERPQHFGFTEWKLSNGVKVWYKKTDYKANEVQMYAFSPGGSGYYSGTDMVQLNFFNDVIASSGLGSFKMNDLTKLLAGKQVAIKPYLTSRSEGFTGAANPKDMRTLCELIYLSFQDLYRDEDAVASILNQNREVLLNKQADPMHDFGDSISVALYGHHPRLLFVKPETVDQVDYDRVLEIYDDRFADASDFTFIFCGNLNEDSLRVYAEEYLAALPSIGRKEKPMDTKLYKLKGERELIYHKEMQTPQCQVVKTWHGPIKYNLKNQMICDILGQVLDIRYIETIREEVGAAYALSAGLGIQMNSADKPEYFLQIFAPLKPELSDTALVVMEQELERIAREGVADSYLNKVKEYMAKSVKEAVKQNGTWISALKTYNTRGVDTMSDYEKLLNEIDSDDLRKMAKRICKDNNTATIMVLPQE